MFLSLSNDFISERNNSKFNFEETNKDLALLIKQLYEPNSFWRDTDEIYPKVNIRETDLELEIVASIPGFDKKDILLEYKNGFLSIRGSRPKINSEVKEKFYLKELKKSNFNRSFKLDDTKIEFNKITSSYKNGELIINIPKKEINTNKNSSLKIDILD